MKIINSNYNSLISRLIFRQLIEAGRKQGKIHGGGLFPTELSTETGDRFSLATVALSLQRERESMKRPRGKLR
jgi:hypothetical protein